MVGTGKPPGILQDTIRNAYKETIMPKNRLLTSKVNFIKEVNSNYKLSQAARSDKGMHRDVYSISFYLEHTLREAQKEKEFNEQHGAVRIIMKDGKKV